jgi:hypothetical protein
VEDRSKINIYTKTSMIIYKFSCRTLFVTMELLYGNRGKGERKRE